MRLRLFRVLLTLSSLSRPLPFRTAPRAPHTSSSRTLKSMPSIPFLSALFGSSASSSSNTMSSSSYPDQRTNDEWRAVLSPGDFPPFSQPPFYHPPILTLVRTIPHPPRKGHRARRHRRLRQALPHPGGRVPLRGVFRASLPSAAQVRLGVRVAGVFRQYPGRGGAARGPHARDGPHRDCVRQLWRAFGACVQGGGV